MMAEIPEWVRFLFQGLMLFTQLSLACIVVSRTGRSPYWALLGIVPYFYMLVIGIWALAFCDWPKEGGEKTA